MCNNSSDLRDKLIKHGGVFITENSLVAFIYLLCRDHLPTGDVQKLLKDSVLISDGDNNRLTNGHLGKYAEYVATNLQSQFFGAIKSHLISEFGEEKVYVKDMIEILAKLFEGEFNK